MNKRLQEADKIRNEHIDEHIKGLYIALENADTLEEREYILKQIRDYEAQKVTGA